MQVKPSVFGSAIVALALSFAVAALAQGTAPVALTADKMKWSSQGGVALPGLEQVSLVGDPSKPGPYTIRLKFPAGGLCGTGLVWITTRLTCSSPGRAGAPCELRSFASASTRPEPCLVRELPRRTIEPRQQLPNRRLMVSLALFLLIK